jgi:hypothetical protein
VKQCWNAEHSEAIERHKVPLEFLIAAVQHSIPLSFISWYLDMTAAKFK